MKDNEKLWLAVYLNVSKIPREHVYEYTNACINSLESDGTVRILVMPIDEESKVECIFDPTHGSNEKYEEFFKKANEYIDSLKKR